ncbi:MAG TPA: class I SAM-dependent methyltransferase [Gaiellaceae bacterium]|nr:class I SAM-dependent methyltransferase [Gaiellaceae bacterium]
MSSSDHVDVERNVASWTRANAEYTDRSAHDAWAQAEITWGDFRVPESELNVLGDVAGKDVIELGCGTAYFSAWLARLGARVVGVDPTPAQLATARRCQQEFGLEFPLVEAAAEDVPLPDASFDLAVSEYGASIWADPYRWIPETARLLRPGGELVFLRNSTLCILCSPDVGKVGERLVRPQFGMHRFDWPDEDGAGGIEFHLAHGDWIRLLRASGFEVIDLVELRAPADAQDHPHYDYVTAEWARQWPAAEIWRARLAGNR